MQSVGEVMAIGRTFAESLQKACRSLELGQTGLNASAAETRFDEIDDDELLRLIQIPTPDRLFLLEVALRRGFSVDEVCERTTIDPWYIDQLAILVEERMWLEEQATLGLTADTLTKSQWKRLKQLGFSDDQLGYLLGEETGTIRAARKTAGVEVTYKTVDTCAAEFEATTPYHYSTYEDTSEVVPGTKPRILILGSGPNRIGQGIEFDYCCVHASFALREAGYETVMVNCNPETVSTDYDTSDRLYFEPITLEDVQNIIEAENPIGIIVSLGGQTPLKLANQLPSELILGTPPSSIDEAEDRDQWATLCTELDIPQPPGGTATTLDGAKEIAKRVGYPVLVRPSYVLGGRAMEIVYDDDDLARAMKALAVDGSLGREGGLSSERPVLIDHFLEAAVEVDVDAIRDGEGNVLIGGVMEHVEEAGIHSGDSACVLPPPNLSNETIKILSEYTSRFADRLDVVGPINVQFAVKDNDVYVIEANPRASRTLPFVSKATGRPLAKISARVMAGATLPELEKSGLLPVEPVKGYFAVKEAVMPFNRFPETDALLGPEMRSTGEVMGLDVSAGVAFVKSQLAAGNKMPAEVNHGVFWSLGDKDKADGVAAAKMMAQLGLRFFATQGTADAFREAGLEIVEVIDRLGGPNRTAVDLIEGGEVHLVVNTPRGGGPRVDGAYIRTCAATHGVPLLTTIAAAKAAAVGLSESGKYPFEVRSLQHIHHGRRPSLEDE